jgi:hypothetical protein
VSRFAVGDLLTVRLFTGSAAWALGCTPLWEGFGAAHGAIDSLRERELLSVVSSENNQGWVRVLSPRGRVGWICRMHVIQVSAQIAGCSVE